MTQNTQHPIMVVTGIRKSAGDFKADNGDNITFSNTVVTVLQDYSDQEKQQGAIGQKSTDYKIKGAQFFNDYLHMSSKLPAQAELIFNWDFTKKTPVAQLVALNFDLKDSKA
jgi:hypothetical protein